MNKIYLDKVIFGDCLKGMVHLEDKSIDLILCDPPYAKTRCQWDSEVPLNKLWSQFQRIIKDHGAIVITAAQPFTSKLVCSNLRMFKYSWVWEKSKATGYLNSKKRPLAAHEDVLVFAKKQPKFNPQMVHGKPYNKGEAHRPTEIYGKQKKTLIANCDGMRYPRSVQYFKTAESEGEVFHPTQKPLALFEFLIKTYTDEGDVVLDSYIGSGTTALACRKLGRHIIGFENNANYFSVIKSRVQNQKMTD